MTTKQRQRNTDTKKSNYSEWLNHHSVRWYHLIDWKKMSSYHSTKDYPYAFTDAEVYP